MPYYVSRQAYYYNGGHFVEVASGGLDYAGPDMLTPHWLYMGEGQTYDDPRDAVEAAIRIARAWRHALRGVVRLTAKGATCGYLGIEGEALTIPQIRKWAAEEWARVEKCDCGNALPPKGRRWRLCNFPEEGEFCSEKCADLRQQIIDEHWTNEA